MSFKKFFLFGFSASELQHMGSLDMICGVSFSCVHTHAQSCLTLCDPRDCSPPGSFVHGIFPTRILEQVAISSSRGYSQPRSPTHAACISCIDRRTRPLSHLGSSPNHWTTREFPSYCLLLSLSWIDGAWNKLWKFANFWSKHWSKDKTFKRVFHVQMFMSYERAIIWFWIIQLPEIFISYFLFLSPGPTFISTQNLELKKRNFWTVSRC